MLKLSRTYRPKVFTQTIILSDGSTYQKLSTSPKLSLRLTKDVRNSQLWNPEIGKTLNNEESGRLARFKGRFDAFGTSQDDDMDWMVDERAQAAPKISERELRESTRKKSGKGGK